MPREPSPHHEDLPRFLEPMLADSGSPPAGDAWAAEVKWDGIRLQVRYDGHHLCARSRPGRDCTESFPELAELAGTLGSRRALLDGELVCLAPDGKPDFAAIRRRLVAPTGNSTATFMIFDVLHLDGRAVRELPYVERRELLAELALEGPAWRTPGHFEGQAKALAEATAREGLEGIVSKRLDAPWTPGRRSPSWVKFKHRRRETLIITGWREARDRPDEYLLARRLTDGRLVPAGSVAYGLDRDRRMALTALLEAAELPRRRGGVRWSAASVEAEVDCHGRPDGPVRDAVLRELILPKA